MQIVFDPVQRSFGVPLQFRQSYTPVDMPLNFDFGIDGLTLSTLAHGNLTAWIEGQVTLFADLDGRTLQGRAGSITAGSNLFSDDTFAFDSTMLGYKLELDGQVDRVGLRELDVGELRPEARRHRRDRALAGLAGWLVALEHQRCNLVRRRIGWLGLRSGPLDLRVCFCFCLCF